MMSSMPLMLPPVAEFSPPVPLEPPPAHHHPDLPLHVRRAVRTQRVPDHPYVLQHGVGNGRCCCCGEVGIGDGRWRCHEDCSRNNCRSVCLAAESTGAAIPANHCTTSGRRSRRRRLRSLISQQDPPAQPSLQTTAPPLVAGAKARKWGRVGQLPRRPRQPFRCPNHCEQRSPAVQPVL